MKIIENNCVKETHKSYTCPHCGSILEVTESEIETENCPCCGELLNEDTFYPYLSHVTFEDMSQTVGVDMNDAAINKLIASTISIMKKEIERDGIFQSPYYYSSAGNTIVAIVYDSECDKWNETLNVPDRWACWNVFVFKDYYRLCVVEDL